MTAPAAAARKRWRIWRPGSRECHCCGSAGKAAFRTATVDAVKNVSGRGSTFTSPASNRRPACRWSVDADKRIWLRSKASLSGWVGVRHRARLAGRGDVVAVTNKVIRRSRPLVAHLRESVAACRGASGEERAAPAGRRPGVRARRSLERRLPGSARPDRRAGRGVEPPTDRSTAAADRSAHRGRRCQIDRRRRPRHCLACCSRATSAFCGPRRRMRHARGPRKESDSGSRLLYRIAAPPSSGTD